MNFVKELFYKLKKLLTKDDDTFVVKMYINIPTKPKTQKPFRLQEKPKPATLFD